jgi:hypothetical protein
MMLADFMAWLEHRPFAVDMAESIWLFPIIETVHVLGLSLVVGSVLMMDLRLLGLGSRNRTVSEILSSVLPWTWSALPVTVIAAALLFSSKATTYYTNLPFRIKLRCLTLAATNMLVFHLGVGRGTSRWDPATPPMAARVAGRSHSSCG